MNNKGFAITTILYGIFLLFMMLLLATIGILSSYKHKVDILIDSNNGARDIVSVYDEGSYLMTIEGRSYYKTNPGAAMIAYVYDGAYTGPLLISTDPSAVVYSTDCTIPECKAECSYNGTKNQTECNIDSATNYVVHNGTNYYYSSSLLWMFGNQGLSNDKFNWPKYTNMSSRDSTNKFLEEKVKYIINAS